jgi:putative transposase
MPRLPRIQIADIPQHVVQVGHNGLSCFFDDEDYEFYLQSLKSAAEQYNVSVHAYVLLPNMIQIVATPKMASGISSLMQSLGRRYVQWVNHRYKRSGTLWDGRYKSSLIDCTSYLLSCYRYVELKPMFKGLCDSLDDYPWSSFRHHAGLDISPIITDHRLYEDLGETRLERCQSYRRLFRYDFDQRLSQYIAETIKLGHVLGGDGFKDKIEQIANQRVRQLKRGRPRKEVDGSVEELVDAIS